MRPTDPDPDEMDQHPGSMTTTWPLHPAQQKRDRLPLRRVPSLHWTCSSRATTVAIRSAEGTTAMLRIQPVAENPTTSSTWSDRLVLSPKWRMVHFALEQALHLRYSWTTWSAP